MSLFRVSKITNILGSESQIKGNKNLVGKDVSFCEKMIETSKPLYIWFDNDNFLKTSNVKEFSFYGTSGVVTTKDTIYYFVKNELERERVDEPTVSE